MIGGIIFLLLHIKNEGFSSKQYLYSKYSGGGIFCSGANKH